MALGVLDRLNHVGDLSPRLQGVLHLSILPACFEAGSLPGGAMFSLRLSPFSSGLRFQFVGVVNAIGREHAGQASCQAARNFLLHSD